MSAGYYALHGAVRTEEEPDPEEVAEERRAGRADRVEAAPSQGPRSLTGCLLWQVCKAVHLALEDECRGCDGTCGPLVSGAR